MSTLIINEGVSPATGIETRTHFADGEIVVEKRYDAEPHVEYARRMREAQEGQRWGDGKVVVHLSAEAYGKVLMIRDQEERKRFIKQYARENPAFVTFDKYLK